MFVAKTNTTIKKQNEPLGEADSKTCCRLSHGSKPDARMLEVKKKVKRAKEYALQQISTAFVRSFFFFF